MGRAVWSGAISFGLVNVPVKLYSAVSRQGVRFHQLHEADGGRVRYRKVCDLDGAELAPEEIVRGYEVAPDRWVTVTDEDLEAAGPEASRAIAIEQFVDLAEIDPVHFEQAYYLVPEKTAARPYALLQRAMEESGRVGVGRVVMRGKEHLVAIRTKDGAILLSTMLYGDEVVPVERVDGVPVAGPALAEKEVALARQLVDALTAPFEPERFRDLHRERVLDVIERKAAGETISAPERAPSSAPKDLLDALQASIEAAKRREARAEA